MCPGIRGHEREPAGDGRHECCFALISSMQRKRLRFGKGFRVALKNRFAQAAEMVLAPGGAEGSAGNRHREVRNTRRGLLRTLNVYVPPACRRDGEPLPRGAR
jgi:hypothetical protein